ncbi:VapB protein of antitoxin of type II toxin-antitoxin system [Gammaproteobacteria bacterium]
MCRVSRQELVNEALKLGNFKTKKEAINTALREFVKQRKQLEIIELFGKFEPDQDYDYKQGCR